MLGYLFLVAYSFLRASLPENCSLLGTNNVPGKISEHIFVPNGHYCLYIPQLLLGNIRSRDAFRPIARKEKDLMDYKG